MIGLLGKKLGQTRVYDTRGNLVPVTVIQAGPNRVVQCKTKESDGYNAVQLGFDEQKEQRLTKAVAGHLRKFATPPVKQLKEFRDFSVVVKAGDVVGADLFKVGDFVDAIGTTKGRGFEGVVKRHGFRGGDSTHGAKGWHRRSGAIGQRLFPGTVMRGMKMPGHMGQVKRTTQNLEVIQVLADDQLLLVKGAVPGAEGDYIVVREAKKRSRAAMEAVARKLEEAKKKAEAGGKGKGGKAGK
jgi:large subunit ribosomal protein L3